MKLLHMFKNFLTTVLRLLAVPLVLLIYYLVEFLFMLLAKVIDVFAKPRERPQDNIRVCAHDGNLECVKRFVGAGADFDSPNLLSKGNNSPLRGTPLSIAAYKGRFEVVKFLIECGARVNPENHNGCPPLLMAAKNGHYHVVEYLLKHGAYVDEFDDDHDTALVYAVLSDSIPVVKLLLAYNAQASLVALQSACYMNSLELVNLLLDYGAPLNPDAPQETALMIACVYRYVDVVKLLLSRGAFVDAMQEDGYTALHIAAAQGDTKIIQMLIDFKANSGCKDKSGDTPLACALRKGHTHVAHLLEN